MIILPNPDIYVQATSPNPDILDYENNTKSVTKIPLLTCQKNVNFTKSRYIELSEYYQIRFSIMINIPKQRILPNPDELRTTILPNPDIFR